MGHLQIRHVDNTVIERLMRRADALGMPVEDYLRRVLTEAAQAEADPSEASGSAPTGGSGESGQAG
ncbi:MAG: hypothetical protein HQL86_05840 [Magnetococcales bacterium]|nr:hypothetical protein [Magnetococcales bacterium]